MQSSTSNELYELDFFFKQEQIVEVQTFMCTFENIYWIFRNIVIKGSIKANPPTVSKEIQINNLAFGYVYRTIGGRF